MSFFGTPCITADISTIYICYHKSNNALVRKLFKLPYKTHNYLVCCIVECITVKLDRRLTKFVHSMINSKNSTVRELIAHFLTTESSVFAENCIYLMYKYDISVFAWYGSLMMLCTVSSTFKICLMNMLAIYIFH